MINFDTSVKMWTALRELEVLNDRNIIEYIRILKHSFKSFVLTVNKLLLYKIQPK